MLKTISNNVSLIRSRVPALLILILMGFTGAGCTITQKVEFKPASTQIDKHAVRIALVMDKAYSELSEYRDPGYQYPLGAYLTPYARHVSETAFSKVTVYDSLNAALTCPDADAVLVPRFVKLEVRNRGVAWDPRRALVVLEWSLKNIKDQKILWLVTVEGRAEGTVGTAFDMTSKDRENMQHAMDDLYAKTVAAFNQSSEIKMLEKTLGK